MSTKKKKGKGNGAQQPPQPPPPALSKEVLNEYYNKMGTPTALQEITQSILEASDDHEVLSILSEIITISAEHAQYTDLSIEENADRAAALRVSAEEKRVKLYNALVNVLGLKWANKINLEQFNPDTPFNGFVIERYPTTDDEGKGPDHMSCRNDNNGTIKTLLWTLARWCATEERRQENPDAEPANFIPKKQGVIDMYATSLIKEDSDKVKREKKALGEKLITVKDQNEKIAKKADMSVGQLSVINYHLMGLQFVLFRLETGRAAPALIYSKEAAKFMWGLNSSSTYGALVVDKPLVRGHRSPHGQNWLTGAQLAYSDELKQALCNAYSAYFSDVEQQTMFENTRVAFEFPKKVSQEAIADMIEQRRKNGRLAATRIYEAREFINALLDSGVCLDEEEAMAVLATWCSASHNLFKGWTFCQSLIALRMAFVACANEHKIEDIFCEAVLNKLDDGMTALFKSTAATVLENTNNKAVSKEGVFAKLAAQHNGWKFNQALVPLRMALVSAAADNGIKDIFSLEVAGKLVGDMKELFKSTAKTVLVNTNNEAVGPERLLLKLAAQHNGWTFNQALYPLRKALVLTAADNGIDDIFCLEVVSMIDDVDMKKLFESTAATTLVNTNGQAVGPDRLLLKLAAQYNSWSFIQLMNVLKWPFIAAFKAIELESSKESVSCDAVFKNLDLEAQELFDKAADMALKKTNNQAVGRLGVYARLAGACAHTLSLMDETFTKHLNEIVQMKENGSEYIKKVGDNEYVPIIKREESALFSYLYRIRDLKEGDTNYWKKQMFLDRGINISKMEDAYKAKAKLDAAKKTSGSKRAAREANTKDRKKKRRPR